MMGPLYWIICFTGMLFMGMYQLNKAKHAEIIKELKERRAELRNEGAPRVNSEPFNALNEPPIISNERGSSGSAGEQD